MFSDIFNILSINASNEIESNMTDPFTHRRAPVIIICS